MSFVRAKSPAAQSAFAIVQGLQTRLVEALESVRSERQTHGFQSVDWLRAQGTFGGGSRYVAIDEHYFNRSSVNISQVQYEGDPSKKLGSATALSTIIHPRNPFAPSMHMHISWTAMKTGEGYWRIMADLNPSIPSDADRKTFEMGLVKAAGEELYRVGKEQGERYFFIPALARHRGVAHFYLEEYHSNDAAADEKLAQTFGETIIETYVGIFRQALESHKIVTAHDLSLQSAYHSLYFLQVLTLDRGTTSGLLVHDENDTGILGSLPSHVDKDLLHAWAGKLPALQSDLLERILGTLNEGDKIAIVDDVAKLKIAKVTREFYKAHPEAMELLARGDRIPPTQENHK
ncbi:MAG: coproporphyrinogen III oxidase [Oligoflexus sp.]|nr:coproporphyrinogen III oxidase [Oligoflexus sp.]